MVNTKMLVGLGFLGVAVYTYSQLEMPTTTNGDLPPNGGGLYVPPNGNGDDDTYAPDCNSMWDASGNRINDGWVSHGQQQVGPWTRTTCDVNGSDVRVYTDKRVYYAGEPINVYVLKKYWETPGLLPSTHHWEKWTTERSFRGETMKFFLGLEGDNALKSFDKYGATTSSLPSSFDLLTPAQMAEYGVVKYRIATHSNSEGVYDLRFGTQLGPYQFGSRCGSSACLDGQHSLTKKCNVKDTTSLTPIIVLSKDCKNPPQASSAESRRSTHRGRFINPYTKREMMRKKERDFGIGFPLPPRNNVPFINKFPFFNKDTPKRTVHWPRDFGEKYHDAIVRPLINKEMRGKIAAEENLLSSQSFLTEWV